MFKLPLREEAALEAGLGGLLGLGGDATLTGGLGGDNGLRWSGGVRGLTYGLGGDNGFFWLSIGDEPGTYGVVHF
jgi:hypothetical protein